VTELAEYTDVSELLVNQCCELRLPNGKSAWGIYKNHDQPGYLRRVNMKPSERFGPCSPEQFCARELILDDEMLVVSLVGIAGTGKTLIALLAAYELLRSGRVSRIEVYRLNAEAGRDLGFLPGDLREKMAPGPSRSRQLDFIIRRMGNGSRFSNWWPTCTAMRRQTATA
jgi:PhoH-like ATPase